MTSIVDTSVKHFLRTGVGAPVLNGTAGSLLAVLSACLVDGYDVKAATSLVVASGVATLSFSGSHSATAEAVVTLSGVTGSLTALNGEQRVTSIGAGVVRFATNAADGTAAGTISFKMSPAGWTKPFTGTNVAVFKSPDVLGTGMYLRVDDTGTTSCRVVGFESMTDVNTRVGPFPTEVQMSGGGYWAKSSLTTSAPVVWALVADTRKFYLHIAPYTATNATYIGGITRSFGDDTAYRPGGDPYACSLSYSASATLGSQSDGMPDGAFALQHAMPRAYTALGSCVLHGPLPFTGGSALSGADTTLGAFPSTIDGGLRLSKKWLGTASTGVPPRCELPGLYHVPMSAAFDTFKTRDIVPGTGSLTGRKLLVLNPSMAYTGVPNAAATGVSLIDITGPWR